jgi:hypothetical protein
MYCGTSCQSQAWPIHKTECKRLAAERFAALLTSAEAGSYESQVEVAECYAEGRGTTKNVVQAAHWHLNSAESCIRDCKIDTAVITVIIAAVRSCADLPNAVLRGCHALLRASVLPRSTVKGEIASAIPRDLQAAVNAGALPALVTVLRVYSRNADIAHVGLMALSNLSNVVAGGQAAIDAGAAAVIIGVMRAHPKNDCVAISGCRALYSIANLTNGEIETIGAGAPAAIVEAMLAHPREREVAEWGVVAFRNMFTFPLGIQAALDSGAPAVIVAALSAHSKSPLVLLLRMDVPLSHDSPFQPLAL